MRGWLFALGLGIGTIAVLIAVGFIPLWQKDRWKVTVHVATPSGTVTGSSVVESRDRDPPRGLELIFMHERKVRGQAIVIPLSKKPLFVLLEPDRPYGFLKFNYDSPQQDRQTFAETASAAIAAGRPFEIPRPNWPRFVYFDDVHDPASVKEADPSQLQKGFGEGTYVLGITVEKSTAPLTRDILRTLPWLTKQRGAFVQAPPLMPVSESPLAAKLTEGDFIRD